MTSHSINLISLTFIYFGNQNHFKRKISIQLILCWKRLAKKEITTLSYLLNLSCLFDILFENTYPLYVNLSHFLFEKAN